ncbi:hypothetical protein JFU37_10875 [Pseudomonas sp. TH41]|uniref:NAD(P)-dependent oxidoreductase n=1 Tax=Pseudomonas sp. TH41 TaxID=2796405 RepID=UPI0019125820|nr:NAD(P)-dependent oxidoreductase [Pseudomonas sp. TH41]MBK5353010.1 hypothetical protein [Pseudomonas sp. TH41]
MRKVLVTGDFEIGDEIFPNDFEIIHIRCPVSEQEILDILPDVQDYILGGPEYLSTQFLNVATRLENLVVMGTGITSFVDLEYATKKGIRVANTPDMNVDAVAEFTLAMLTICLANVFESIERVKEGTGWVQTPRTSLANLSVGFVGMGAIGCEIARQLHSKGCMGLQYWSRTKKPDLEESLGLQYNNLVQMVSSVDVLCVHLKGCADTWGLIDEGVLKSASPTLKILNMSSPRIICPTALKGFLQANTDAFCFIDGYYSEWVDNKGQYDDPYGLQSLSSKSLVVTSHLAAQERETVSRMFAQAATRVLEFTRCKK